MDLPGAFLHADNDDLVIMKMTGKLAELMAKTDPHLYRPFVINDSKGQPILYVRLQKALYGLLKSALLFYQKLVADLTSLGFTINPYDPCVANKIVSGKQLTVSWHVDDLQISHVHLSVVECFIQQLKEIYGSNLKATVGPIQDYLGMVFDYTQPGIVDINMDKYIKKVISDFPKVITGVASSPATNNLFKVRDDAPKHSDQQAIHFHHTVAQLLFVSRRDIIPDNPCQAPRQQQLGKIKTCPKIPQWHAPSPP